MTIAPTVPPTRLSWSQARDALSAHVGTAVTRLQHEYRGGGAAAAASLAQLRAASTLPPEDVSEVWEAAGIDPEGFGLQRGDMATPLEKAAHTALTLYGWHQQSRRDADMHVPKRNLGAALGLLARAADDPAAKGAPASAASIRTRFKAAGTAIDVDELNQHLRRLVSQLRSAGIGMDYAQLARDLFAWQHPRSADTVRLAWGRAWHRNSPKPNNDD